MVEGGGGGVHWLDPLGYCMFGQGVKHGVDIHKAFSSWEMVSEKHFFDVEDVSCIIYL